MHWYHADGQFSHITGWHRLAISVSREQAGLAIWLYSAGQWRVFSNDEATQCIIDLEHKLTPTDLNPHVQQLLQFYYHCASRTMLIQCSNRERTRLSKEHLIWMDISLYSLMNNINHLAWKCFWLPFTLFNLQSAVTCLIQPNPKPNPWQIELDPRKPNRVLGEYGSNPKSAVPIFYFF